MSTTSQIEESRGRNLIQRGRGDPKAMACRSPHIDMSVQTEPDFEDEKLQAVLQEKDKEIERLMSVKDNEIRALNDKLELLTRPRSTATTEAETSLNINHLDDTDAQLMRARNEVKRLRNKLTEKDERITEYERELHSQREQAKIDTQRNDETIQALKKELNVLREKAAMWEADRSKERVANMLQAEQLCQQCKETARLKDVMDRLIRDAKRQARHIKVTEEERDALKLEAEQLRRQCKETARLKDVSDHFIRDTKRQARRIKATEEERDALKLEAEQLRQQCKETARLKDVMDHFKRDAKCQARRIKATEEERDGLKLEVEQLRGQCKDAAALKEQLNITTVQHAKLKKGISALLVIVIMFVIFFIVGLLWTLIDSPNTYTMPVASVYKMSSSHNSIIATAMPFHNIIV